MSACRVVLGVFAAIDRGDAAAARRLLGDDFAKRSAAEGRVAVFGADEWLAALSPLDAAFSPLDHGVRCADAGPTSCSGTFNVRARHTGVLELAQRGVRLPPTGRTVELPPEPFTAEVRDGLLVLLEVQHPDGGGIAGMLRQLTG